MELLEEVVMAKSVDREENTASTILPFNKKNEFEDTHPTSTKKNYKQLLEDKIKEKKSNLEINAKDVKGGAKEHLQKKRAWMNEIIKPLMEISDVLEQTKIIEIKLIYRRGKVASKVAANDPISISIKSREYDDSKIIKSGFKLDINFCPRSQALDNKTDCYLVQLLGNAIEHKTITKYYNVDALMEFIINYCSEYIAEVSNKT